MEDAIIPVDLESKTEDEKDKPHNGKPITKIEVSPNGYYLVTYSEEDHSIVGWNAGDIDEGRLEPDLQMQEGIYIIKTIKIVGHKKINQIRISDNRKLVYISNYIDFDGIDIVDMNNQENEIKLDLHPHSDYHYHPYYCVFNLKGEFILCNEVANDLNNHDKDKVIWIYSTQSKNKWLCKGIYKIPNNFKLIDISKYDKLYLFSNHYFYEWSMLTEKSIRIFTDKYNKEEHHHQKKGHHKYHNDEVDVKITSNEKFICLRFKDKTIIYSIELEIPIVKLYDDIQLYNFINHSDLYSLLPSLFDLFDHIPSSGIWNSVIKYYWKECIDRLKMDDWLMTECQTESSLTLPNLIQIKEYFKRDATKYKCAFGALDRYVWKFKFEERLKKINFSESKLSIKNWSIYSENEIIESWYTYLGFDELNNENDNMINNDYDNEKEIFENQNIYFDFDDYDEYLNLQLFNPDMNTIHKLFQNAIANSTIIFSGERVKLYNNLIKWEAEIDYEKIKLQVFKGINKNSILWSQDPICATYIKIEKVKNYFREIIASSLLNNNDIAIITNIGFFIFHFNENNKSISLNYFYSMNLVTLKDKEKNLPKYKKEFLKDYLPLSNYNSFKSNRWISHVKGNKENLLKYGVELLTFAIKNHRINLVEEIYKKCMIYFNEDHNNRKFLSIISSTMPLLIKYYPEYISRYSSDTDMIIDSSLYNIEYQSSDLHLHSQNFQIMNLTKSLSWTKYQRLLEIIEGKKIPKTLLFILYFIQLLIIILTFPFFMATFYMLSKHHFINNIYKKDLFSKFYFYTSFTFDKIFKNIPEKFIPTITFMVPYVKVVNYSHDYNWFLDWMKPQPSPFIEIIKYKEIYQTWTGEVLINFKWNTYGKYYYALIWIGFTAYIGCFTAAATLPQEYLTEDKRKFLLIASIILGFVHLSFEIRQIIYNYKKWFHNPWNWFDTIAFLLPIYTSIYWLQTNDKNDEIIQLLSFSCLFLDLRFLLFFKVFESFGRYFAIIVNVGKKVFSFLAILLIIIISFAHAFYILLSPKSEYSFEEPKFNDDPNNPWSMTPMYKVFNNDDSDFKQSIVQQPDENINMFIDYGSALFAVYFFSAAGDQSVLSNWSYKNNPSLVLLTVLFSFLVFIYLMNLFIGLLSNVIEEDDNRISYLMQKAEALAEIELFYLFPFQRRWKQWFPEVIYYYADFDKTRERVNEMIHKGEWNANEFPEMKKSLLKALNIDNS